MDGTRDLLQGLTPGGGSEDAGGATRTSQAAPGGRIPVWLDCDPGHDDAFAIILAAYSPRLELLGISTVAGNQAVDKVTRNALDVLHAAGAAGVGVFQGQAKPLLAPAPTHCPEIHGDSGLDGPMGGPVLPHCGAAPAPGKAPVVMGERIAAFVLQHPGRSPVRLVCTGALTNAALMLSLYPELHRHLEIVIMGGAIGAGNTSPAAEFNIQIDPEAARLVFEAGVPLTMVPLEVTHTALVTPDVLSRLLGGGGGGGGDGAARGAPGGGGDTSGGGGAPGGARARAPATRGPTRFLVLAEQLLTFFATTYREVFGFEHPPLHDPCAVAYVIDPSLFKAELMRVDVETCSRLSPGQTVCDVWHQTGRPKNCTVAKAMDTGAFWDLMIAALRTADAASPLN